MIIEIVIGIGVFAATLLLLTYASALVADVSGTFRLLFIQTPYRQIFRLVRWLLAGVAAVSVVAAIE